MYKQEILDQELEKLNLTDKEDEFVRKWFKESGITACNWTDDVPESKKVSETIKEALLAYEDVKDIL